MEDFNNDFTSLTSVKRSPVAKPSFNDAGGNNENELNPEMASKLKSPSNKQFPSKNFMSPTISAANKASFPKKKILAERNQTPDVVEQTSLLRSSSLDSKSVKFPFTESDDDVEKDFVGLQPYDPIKNYLSPRPKFLRYNPDRRRKILVLQENEDGVRNSGNSLDSGVTSSGLELREDSSGSTGSCSRKESAEEAKDMIPKEGEGEGDTGSCSQKESVEEAKDMIELKGEGEDDEEDEIEEVAELGEDKGCSLKGFLKFLVVVVTLISMTQAICSMNSNTTSSQNLEGVWGFNDWYGKTWSSVHGPAGLNFSEVGDLMRESGFLVGRLKEEEVSHDYEGLDAVETIEELVEELQGLELVAPDNEVENDETDVIQHADQLQLIEILQEDETAESEAIEIHEVEAEIEVPDLDFNQDGVIEEEQSDANEKSSKLTIDVLETAKDMEEDEVEEIDELETGLVGFDLIVGVLIGLPILILTSFGVIYHSRWMKMKMKSSSPVATMVANENLVAEKEDIKNPEPAPSSIQPIAEELLANSASLVVHPTPKDVTNEISRVHAPTVELLGEFVFGGEVTNSSLRSNETKSDTISTEARPITASSGQTRSSHMGDSLRNTDEKMVKKPRRKIAEVTPSPVRRSNRIQNRSSAVIMSP